MDPIHLPKLCVDLLKRSGDPGAECPCCCRKVADPRQQMLHHDSCRFDGNQQTSRRLEVIQMFEPGRDQGKHLGTLIGDRQGASRSRDLLSGDKG